MDRIRDRSRLTLKFHPRLETLEGRFQPGSLFFGSALDADLARLGATALDHDLEQQTPAIQLTRAITEAFLNLDSSPQEQATVSQAPPQTGAVVSQGTTSLPSSWMHSAAPRVLQANTQPTTQAAVLAQAVNASVGRPVAAATLVVAPQRDASAQQLLDFTQLSADQIQQAALTGESAPVQVRAVDVPVVTHRFDEAGTDTSNLYSTYFGMGGEDAGRSITVDSANNSYSTGYFGFGDDRDLFITKVNAQGALVWVSFFGSTGADEGHSVGVDGAGNVYVTGFYTNELGDQEAIVGRFGSDGGVQYVLAFTNAGVDSGNGLTMAGDIFFVTGSLDSASGSRTLVASFALDGSIGFAVSYTFFAGPSEGNGIVVDAEYNAYLVGTLNENGANRQALYLSVDGFGGLRYAYTLQNAGEDAGYGLMLSGSQLLLTGVLANDTTGTDGFIGTANAADGILEGLTLITSGVGTVVSHGIVMDNLGSPVIVGALGLGKDNLEGIIVKVIPNVGLDYFMMAGSGNEIAYGVARGVANAAYVVGKTNSEDFPVTEGALQQTYGGGASDAWGGLFGLD